MAATLMMSAKMASLGLLKRRVFWNKGYDVMRLWELKVKVRKFWGLVPMFVEVTREKLVKFGLSPPSWIGSMTTPMEGCFCWWLDFFFIWSVYSSKKLIFYISKVKSCKLKNHLKMIAYVFQKYPENFAF